MTEEIVLTRCLFFGRTHRSAPTVGVVVSRYCRGRPACLPFIVYVVPFCEEGESLHFYSSSLGKSRGEPLCSPCHVRFRFLFAFLALASFLGLRPQQLCYKKEMATLRPPFLLLKYFVNYLTSTFLVSITPLL